MKLFSQCLSWAPKTGISDTQEDRKQIAWFCCLCTCPHCFLNAATMFLPKIKIIKWTGRLPPESAAGSDHRLEEQPLILWLCGWKHQRGHSFRNHAVRENIFITTHCMSSSVPVYLNHTLSLSHPHLQLAVPFTKMIQGIITMSGDFNSLAYSQEGILSLGENCILHDKTANTCFLPLCHGLPKSSCGTAWSLPSLLPPGSPSSCATWNFSFWYLWSPPPPPKHGGRAGRIILENWCRQVSVHVEMGHKVPRGRQSSQQHFSPFACSTLDFLKEPALTVRWRAPTRTQAFWLPVGIAVPRRMTLSPPQHPLSPIMPHPSDWHMTESSSHL